MIFVALRGEAALGFTQIYPSFSSVSARQLWIFYDLFVAPEVRGHSVGAALLEKARQFAVETGTKGLTMATAVDNLPTQRLYEKPGWKRDETFYHYHLDA